MKLGKKLILAIQLGCVWSSCCAKTFNELHNELSAANREYFYSSQSSVRKLLQKKDLSDSEFKELVRILYKRWEGGRYQETRTAKIALSRDILDRLKGRKDSILRVDRSIKAVYGSLNEKEILWGDFIRETTPLFFFLSKIQTVESVEILGSYLSLTDGARGGKRLHDQPRESAESLAGFAVDGLRELGVKGLPDIINAIAVNPPPDGLEKWPPLPGDALTVDEFKIWQKWWDDVQSGKIMIEFEDVKGSTETTEQGEVSSIKSKEQRDARSHASEERDKKSFKDWQWLIYSLLLILGLLIGAKWFRKTEPKV